LEREYTEMNDLLNGEMAGTFTLVTSTCRGRYALDYPHGIDVTSGTRLMVLLGGRWISGIVEHGRVYSGECCGLCLCMRVQVQY
jgi:hypothetical protein